MTNIPSEAGELLERLGVDIDAETFLLSLTHRSYAFENPGVEHNERLEFLGDSVLSLAIAEEVYRRHPELPEGELVKLHHVVVSAPALAIAARKLELGKHIRLGKVDCAHVRRRANSQFRTRLENRSADAGNLAVLGRCNLRDRSRRPRPCSRVYCPRYRGKADRGYRKRTQQEGSRASCSRSCVSHTSLKISVRRPPGETISCAEWRVHDAVKGRDAGATRG